MFGGGFVVSCPRRTPACSVGMLSGVWESRSRGGGGRRGGRMVCVAEGGREGESGVGVETLALQAVAVSKRGCGLWEETGGGRRAARRGCSSGKAGRAGAAGERCAWRVRQASDRRGRKAGRAGGEREGGSGGCSDDQPGAVTSQHTVCSMNSLLLCSLPTDAGQFTRYTAAAHIIRKQGYRRQQRSSALSLSRALHRCLVTPPGA